MTRIEKLNERDGIWQLHKQMEDPEQEGWLNDQFTFVLDGNEVTVYLLAEHPVPQRSDDDVYKLKAKWKENTLFYLAPLSLNWIPLAIYENGEFCMRGRGQKRIFRKIKAEEVSSWTKDVLKQRDLFDYTKVEKGGQH